MSNTIEMTVNEEKLVETEEVILSTKGSSSINLNGDMKSSVLYNLNDLIDFESDNTIDFITVSVPYAVIPNSMYNINVYNNLFIYQTASVSNINIPYGNYTYQSFMTYFNANTPFTISYVATTNKFRISCATAFQLPAGSTIDYIMGWSSTTVLQSTDIAPYYIDFPRVINFLPPPIINVCCDQISNGQCLGRDSRALFSNILASIPNTSKLNAELVYQNAQDEFVIKNISHNNIVISILDDAGRFIDFNGISSYFLLRFRIHKKVKKVKGSFNDFLINATNIRDLIEPATSSNPVEYDETKE